MRGALVVALVLLAGCTGSEGMEGQGTTQGDLDAPDAGEPSVNETVHRFERTFSLSVSGAHAPGINMSNGLQSNCLAFPEGLTIVTGNATATWTAQSPTVEELAVAFDVGEETLLAQGASPAVLDLAGAVTEEVFDGKSFLAVEHPRDLPSAAYQQPVELVVAFDYLGPPEFDVEEGWDCQIG